MSLCIICLLLLLKHICVYIYIVLYYEQKWSHRTHTTACFSFTGQSPVFCGSCMCRPFVSTLRRLHRAWCKANACFPLSQIWSPVPWKSSPGPVLFCPSLHIYTLSSLPSSRVALLISLLLQKAICFMIIPCRY